MSKMVQDCTKIKVICQGQGQILRLHFSKNGHLVADSVWAIVFHKHSLFVHGSCKNMPERYHKFVLSCRKNMVHNDEFFTIQSQILMTIRKKAFENIVGNEENEALPSINKSEFSTYIHFVICIMLSICTNLNVCCLAKSLGRIQEGYVWTLTLCYTILSFNHLRHKYSF